MMPSFARETVRVTRAPLVESRGTKVRDWARATTHTLPYCLVTRGGTSGSVDVRESSDMGLNLLCPLRSDIEQGDKVVRKDGTAWVVVGIPQPNESPTGRLDHKRAQLKKWEG